MKLLNNIEINDLGLYLVKEKILIIGDLHIGIEDCFISKGILIPKFHFKEIIERLEGILDKLEINKIIVNGDIKDDFSKINEDEWRNSLKLIDFLEGKSELIFIKGNHDTFMDQIATKRKIKFVKEIKVGNILILHGDFIPDKIEEKIIIIGHEHPAINLREKTKVERYKCFLKGKWKGKTLIVMPSFNLFKEGTDILEGKRLSPFLQGNLNNFEVYVVGDKIYNFGKLKNF